MSVKNRYLNTKVIKKGSGATKTSPTPLFEAVATDRTKDMIIIPSNDLIYKDGIWVIAVYWQSEIPHKCPYDNGELKYRDSKERNSKNIEGKVDCYRLRRLRCLVCAVLHTEIPDIIQPYKHYNARVIQSVLDGNKEAESCNADTSTFRRWKNSFSKAAPDINQRLASITARETNEITPIIHIEQILDHIRTRQKQWLSFVMGLLINNGHRICTQFAFFMAEITDKISMTGQKKAKGGPIIDKTVKNSE